MCVRRTALTRPATGHLTPRTPTKFADARDMWESRVRECEALGQHSPSHSASTRLQLVCVRSRPALINADARQTIGSILLANAVEVDEGSRALDKAARARACVRACVFARAKCGQGNVSFVDRLSVGKRAQLHLHPLDPRTLHPPSTLMPATHRHIPSFSNRSAAAL